MDVPFASFLLILSTSVLTSHLEFQFCPPFILEHYGTF